MTMGVSYLCFRMIHVLIDHHNGTIPKLKLLPFLNYALFAPGEIPHYTLAPGDYSAKISVTDSDRNIVIPETTKKFTVLKDKKVKAK
jgi:hypothetical protein